MHTVTEEPERGWKVQPANTEGYYIIVSGTSQMNQTNGGHDYQIYNWGEGKNITDTGCQFAFTFWRKEKPLRFTLHNHLFPILPLKEDVLCLIGVNLSDILHKKEFICFNPVEVSVR